jgi:putative ABC transport system permease protein
VLRNSLVVFQFATSVALIISTVVIYNQMHFILNKKLGYNKDQVLLLQGANTLGDNNVKNLKTSLLKLPQVQNVSVSDYLPIEGTKRNGNTFWMNGKQNTEQGVDCQHWVVDEDYLNTLGINMVAGRNFSPQMRSDSNAVVINQTLVKKLNLKNPIGALISNGYTYRVVGVVQDFNFESLRSEVGALVLQLGNSPSIISVKMHTGDVRGTIASISSIWKTISPAQPIRYTFLDESFAAMYADVQRMAGIFTSFASLAIVIACLGLFGLSAFMAEQRSKEIGIRKVLGASIGSITALVSKDFIRLVFIAIVIATPVAWWGMNNWLQEFAYRAPISAWVFVLAGASAVLIALVTVSFQSIKAALMNPVKAIRAE